MRADSKPPAQPPPATGKTQQDVSLELRLPEDPENGLVEIIVRGPPSARVWAGALEQNTSISIFCRGSTTILNSRDCIWGKQNRAYEPITEKPVVLASRDLTAEVFWFLLDWRDEKRKLDRPWQLKIIFKDLVKLPDGTVNAKTETLPVAIAQDYLARIPERYRERVFPHQDIPADNPAPPDAPPVSKK